MQRISTAMKNILVSRVWIVSCAADFLRCVVVTAGGFAS
jgi:hypothetical protein